MMKVEELYFFNGVGGSHIQKFGGPRSGYVTTSASENGRGSTAVFQDPYRELLEGFFSVILREEKRRWLDNLFFDKADMNHVFHPVDSGGSTIGMNRLLGRGLSRVCVV